MALYVYVTVVLKKRSVSIFRCFSSEISIRTYQTLQCRKPQYNSVTFFSAMTTKKPSEVRVKFVVHKLAIGQDFPLADFPCQYVFIN